MTRWISRNAFLGEEDMRVNAHLVWECLSEEGFSRSAIAAILGNMEAESTINPGIWEGLQPYVGGYGLVQWTPYDKYADWAGEDWQDNGYKECARIAYEFRNGIQYYPTSVYPITASEFKVSDDTPETLAGAWMYNYERPWSYDTEWYRAERARYWYDLIGAWEEKPKDPDIPEKGGNHSWLYIHRD